MKRMLNMRAWLLLLIVSLSGCAALSPGFTDPEVKVVGLKLLPAQQGEMAPRLGVQLAISNPNNVDLSVTGMSYSIDLDGFSLLSGVRADVPTFKAYSETPLELSLSADVIQMVKLVRALAERPANKPLEYEFNAKLDTGRFSPAIRVSEAGTIALDSL
ncbi:LEA type 2 family protein [Gilvimarinus sp. DA14]|uniref:LEA type 2 family protein n=1 Tax=Gilvimarinus sp. DA14 TaxID=2956798 RepID=UPI0020B6F488|nr:LEA type 2 family protein [Gilvimarinus sp. DA14]UTF61646.1 LEA type 2 family protein [Gilvimarinus sp. DA14]